MWLEEEAERERDKEIETETTDRQRDILKCKQEAKNEQEVGQGYKLSKLA